MRRLLIPVRRAKLRVMRRHVVHCPQLGGPSCPMMKVPGSMRTSFMPMEFVIGSAAGERGQRCEQQGGEEGEGVFHGVF